MSNLVQLFTSDQSTVGASNCSFFDGDLWGNPGRGGSGLVLVRVDTDLQVEDVVWAASMSYAQDDTIKNTAEYRALIHGLRRAVTDHVASLHVVGESAMIVKQMRRHLRPHRPRLRRLFHLERRCADVMGVGRWTHHYRKWHLAQGHYI